MTTRILPPEEWGKLDGTELAAWAPQMDPTRATVVVVEDEAGTVIGCWALVQVLHAEGVWVAPSHRGRASVARRLVRATLEAARQRGVRAVATAAVTPDVERLLTRHLGATELPGKQYVLATGG
jgi:ribosomal protein S18 acetylase RimI-like enzyme